MTAADLAVVTQDEAALAQLDRHAVVELLERGKTWLQQALDRDTAIGELVNYKGEATVLRELVIQKELGRDAELAATELVRRAERSIGQAVRRGQERGEIRVPHVTSRRPGHDRASAGVMGPAEAAGVKHSSSVSDLYELADDVSDEQFDTAVEQAKAEGDLNRSNVARKLGKRQPSASKRAEPPRPPSRLDGHTVITKTVEAAADVITQSLLDEVDYAELDTQDLTDWVGSLTGSIKALQGLRARLNRELNHR